MKTTITMMTKNTTTAMAIITPVDSGGGLSVGSETDGEVGADVVYKLVGVELDPISASSVFVLVTTDMMVCQPAEPLEVVAEVGAAIIASAKTGKMVGVVPQPHDVIFEASSLAV
jgi:hypothetical protein